MLVEKSEDGFRVTVPCKINLFLEVLGRRLDGYHDVDTVMMAVSLCDVLEIRPTATEQLELSVVIADANEPEKQVADETAWLIPSDNSNLVVRALDKLRVSLGKPNVGATIRLTKQVPAMAGLGGGSANAAAALVLGSLLWSDRLNEELIRSIASELGSDVNFFLEANRFEDSSYWVARCTGRGERIEPVANLETLHFVLVKPPIGCNTAKVFANYARQKDLERNGNSIQNGMQIGVQNPASLIEGLRKGDVTTIGQSLLNRLEPAAERTTEWIGRSAKCFDRYDHLGQTLSGSGSARFCLCSDAAQAEKIVNALRVQGDMRAYYAQSWRSPSIDSQIKQLRNHS